MKEMYRESPSMMELVVREHNIQKAIKKVKRIKVPGIDGMKVSEIQGHFAQYFPKIKQNCLKVHINLKQLRKLKFPKQMGKRVLGIPVVRDRVIQQAIKQVIEPSIDRTFSKHSHGFRPNRSTGTALKECASYYEAG